MPDQAEDIAMCMREVVSTMRSRNDELAEQCAAALDRAEQITAALRKRWGHRSTTSTSRTDEQNGAH